MAEISNKDIAAFARVLRAIAQACEQRPSELIELLGTTNAGEATEPDRQDPRLVELSQLDLFQLAAGQDGTGLEARLKNYDTDQLRYLIRKYRLGSIKSRSQQTLLAHMIDQLLKRGVDVFKSHE